MRGLGSTPRLTAALPKTRGRIEQIVENRPSFQVSTPQQRRESSSRAPGIAISLRSDVLAMRAHGGYEPPDVPFIHEGIGSCRLEGVADLGRVG